MDEAKRIIRYMLPGMTYIILLLLTFIIIKPSTAKALFLKSENISAGKAIGVFIISGGLGYLFSIIYFGFYWLLSFTFPRGHVYNHLKVINNLVKVKKLKILTSSDGSDFDIVKGRQAWYIVNVFWHSRPKDSVVIKGVNKKLDSYYSDMTTGLATTLVASICSLLTFLFLVNSYYNCWNCWDIVLCFVIYGLFIVLSLANFLGTYRAYEVMVNIAFASEVENEYKKNMYKPIEVFYPK